MKKKKMNKNNNNNKQIKLNLIINNKNLYKNYFIK